MINPTANNMEKSNNDLSDVVSMIDSTVNKMEKSDDNLDNIVLMIGHAEAAWTT